MNLAQIYIFFLIITNLLKKKRRKKFASFLNSIQLRLATYFITLTVLVVPSV